MRSISGFLLLFASFLLTGCNLPRGGPEPTLDPGLVGTIVAQTLVGFPTPEVIGTPSILQTETSTPAPLEATQTPAPSAATGKVCFPISGRTDMKGFFQELDRGTVVEIAISASADSYEVALDPGRYIAYVWLPDFSRSGMYSTGKTPTPFDVAAGQTTPGIDLCGWSHGPFDVPYPPGYQPQQTSGSIAGTISYPYGAIPQLTVVAFGKSSPYWYWVGTGAGQSYFSIGNLPPGKYQVVAYDGSGHAGGSGVVSVKAGESTSAEITDWGGSFPSNPVK